MTQQPELYDLIRTVEEAFEDGSEALLHVKAMRARTGDEAIVVSNPNADEASILIYSRTQAERLVRAINAAARALDWEDLPVVELAQEAICERRRKDRVEAEHRSVTRTEVEYSYAWCAANPNLAGSKWSRDLGVPIDTVSVVWREKERGIGDLCVWRSGEPVACRIPHNASPSAADIALCAYLGEPEGITFDFTRDGFVTIVRTYAKS